MRGGTASREIIVLLFFTCVGKSVANAESSGANIYFSGSHASGASALSSGANSCCLFVCLFCG